VTLREALEDAARSHQGYLTVVQIDSGQWIARTEWYAGGQIHAAEGRGESEDGALHVLAERLRVAGMMPSSPQSSPPGRQRSPASDWTATLLLILVLMVAMFGAVVLLMSYGAGCFTWASWISCLQDHQ
jgi:hypothetical protein